MLTSRWQSSEACNIFFSSSSSYLRKFIIEEDIVILSKEKKKNFNRMIFYNVGNKFGELLYINKLSMIARLIKYSKAKQAFYFKNQSIV